MMQKMELKGVHLEIDDKLRKYTERKLGGLDRLLSKHSKASAHLEVTLKESKPRGGKQCHCELMLHLPHDTIVIKEATVNMYAAVDIAEAKLKLALKKYREVHDAGMISRHLVNKLRRNNRNRSQISTQQPAYSPNEG